MKSKDLGFFTRHVEKLILGGGILLALLITVLYVTGQPYARQSQGRTLDPQALESEIAKTAERVETSLRNYDQFPQIPVPPYAQEFATRLNDSAAPSSDKLPPLARTGLGKDVAVAGGPQQPYLLPHPPMATDVMVYDSYSVFDPTNTDLALEESQITSIFQMIGNRQPADFPFVSVEGKFDMDAWIKRLDAKPSAGNLLALPKVMWRGKQAISAVYLLRQELDPATGQWSEPIIVPPLPTQVAFQPDFSQDFDDQTARDTLQNIKENQELIARPNFIPVAVHARQWLPPEKAEKLSPEDNRKLDSLNRRIASLTKQLDTIDQQLERQSNRPEQPQQALNPRAGAAAPRQSISSIEDFEEMGMGDMGGGGFRTGGGATRAAPGAAAANRLQDLQQRRVKLVEDLQIEMQKRDELQGVELDAATSATQQYMVGGPGSMGFDEFEMFEEDGFMPMQAPGSRYPSYGRGMPYGRGNAFGRGPVPQPGVVPGQEEVSQVVRVWAHDLTIQRGHTYRYRLMVSVVNPLFRENRVQADQKAENYNKISLGPSEQELAAAPWTDPVVIESEFNFFLVSAAQQQVATVEVWRYFDGMPRKADFTIQPGDPIGRPSQIDGLSIDMNVGAVLVDLVPQTTRTGVGGTTRMLYIQPGQPQILSRSMEQDRDSDERLRLQNEREIIKRLQELISPTASALPSVPVSEAMQ
ncbi:MAG: hypothetical protein IT445_07495 [Phycisphaeraceae bacterium]|nr:hypothetical protein [Phycisphaeraceae bacterium]